MAVKKSLSLAPIPPFPAPVMWSDLKPDENYKNMAYESWDSASENPPHYTSAGGYVEFELWYTERFGWCIPTLQIRGLSARLRNVGAQTRRSYAIAIKDEQLVSIGIGPHVKATKRVFVRKSRIAALKPLLDLMVKGAEKAGECRDRISSRRANTILNRRSAFGGAWNL